MGRLNTHNTEPFPLLCAGLSLHGDEQRAAQGLPFMALRSGLEHLECSESWHLRLAAHPRALYSLQSISMLFTLLVLRVLAQDSSVVPAGTDGGRTLGLGVRFCFCFLQVSSSPRIPDSSLDMGL